MSTILQFLLCCLVWGSTWYAITFQLGVHSLWSVFYRFMLASVIMAFYCAFKGHWLRFTWRQHIRLFLQGSCLCGLSFYLLYESERFISSGLTAIVTTSVLYFNVLISRIWLSKPIQARVVLGGLLGSMGVCLIMLPELNLSSFQDTAVNGVLFALAGALATSLGCVCCEDNEREGLPMLPVVTLNMVYGGLSVASIALVSGIPPHFEVSIEYIGSLVYLTIFGSIVALTSYISLIRKLGADRAAFVEVVYPIFALCLSSLLEGYAWSTVSLLGGAVIAAGNIIALKPDMLVLHQRSA